MHIGTLVVTVLLHQADSLKDKRHVIKSLVDTTRQKFNVSVAEIADLDTWRSATLGVAVVSNDSQHCNRVLDKLLDSWESNPNFEVVAIEMEID